MDSEYTPLFRYPAVKMCCYPRDNGLFCARYIGSAEDLIAAGVATAEMLMPGTKGKPRVDEDGDRCVVTARHWVGIGTARQRKILKLVRVKPLERLPHALAERRRQPLPSDDQVLRNPSVRAAFGLPELAPRRPVLRLVVDNTRQPA